MPPLTNVALALALATTSTAAAAGTAAEGEPTPAISSRAIVAPARAQVSGSTPSADVRPEVLDQTPAKTRSANASTNSPGGASLPLPRVTANGSTPLRLSPPRAAATPLEKKDAAARGYGSSVVLVGSSLAMVLGLFFLVVWVLRRGMPTAARPLPTEVFEVLGRSVLFGRQQVQLVRFGPKMLLVSVSTAGAETLAEITSPADVDRLAGLCQQARQGSTTMSFRQILSQFGGDADGNLADGTSDPPRFGQSNFDQPKYGEAGASSSSSSQVAGNSDRQDSGAEKPDPAQFAHDPEAALRRRLSPEFNQREESHA